MHSACFCVSVEMMNALLARNNVCNRSTQYVLDIIGEQLRTDRLLFRAYCVLALTDVLTVAANYTCSS